VLDLLDPDAVRKAVTSVRPDAIIHQATALSDLSDFRNPDKEFAQTNRLRTDGTNALLAAAREADVSRFVAQSFTSWPYAREGGPVKTEADPLDPEPVPTMRETLDAIRHLEQAVVGAGGIALRYGGFYGSPDDAQLELVRKRRFPIVGDGGGIWSFVHLDDAAAATVLALEDGEPGIYNVVDDEPAPVREWLPALADAIGAKPPRHVPRWLARIVAGEAGVALMTEIRGASNAKAKRQLGWTLRYPSWRQGFPAAYSSLAHSG
jgi:nucleoside-diphosphate-sugar epimerase